LAAVLRLLAAVYDCNLLAAGFCLLLACFAGLLASDLLDFVAGRC
jgi:hypothetical protein